MADEEAFLRAAVADPADATLVFVYSDWLEERGDDVSTAKAMFLRQTARLRALAPEESPEARRRLQELAARLDPAWLAVVSRLAVENCGMQRPQPTRLPYFDFQGDRSWDRMQPTTDPTVRFCTSCGENVYYCDTVVTARQHAREGHCIAVDLGIIRRKGDLAVQGPTPGFPSEEWWEEEAVRVNVDPVSAEREERKRQRGPTFDEGEPGTAAPKT